MKMSHSVTPGPRPELLWLLGLLTLLLPQYGGQAAFAQRVLLFEDFEGATSGPPMPELCRLEPSELPEGTTLADVCIGTESVDTYNRSRVVEGDPSLATVTGTAEFPDPFDVGNKSLVLHNPNQATQMAVNFFSIFPDDAADPHYYLRNGVIEFDVYLEEPLPGSLYTFLGVRFGFEPNPGDRNQVATTGDQTIWNVFNIFGDAIEDPAKRQIAEETLLQRASPNFEDNLYDQANDAFFLDPAGDVIAAGRAMHVRYDINGDEATYTVTIDNLDDPDDPVEIPFAGETVRPWVETFNFQTFQFEPAPGINEISFMSDASGFAVSDVSQNVYLDNLRIVDHDQEPLPRFAADFDKDGDVDGDDFLIWQAGFNQFAGSATANDGDADGDGDVDGDDFLRWQKEFGSASPGGASIGSGVPSIPEPTAAILLSAAALAAGLATTVRR